MTKLLEHVAAYAITAIASTVATAMPIELITNGGFETGTLAGWSASSSNVDLGGWDTGWNVSTSAQLGGAYDISDPIGSYAAYESFDGTGPKTRTLMQSLVVPDNLSQAVLSFWDSYYVTTFHGGTLPRLVDVYLSDGVVTDNVYHFESRDAYADTFALMSFDVTSFLQERVGDTVQLSFVTTIPEYGTGPGGFGLDNVSLVAQVPEPATLALLGLCLAALAYSCRRTH